MSTHKKSPFNLIKRYLWHALAVVLGVAIVVAVAYFGLPTLFSVSYDGGDVQAVSTTTPQQPVEPSVPPLDKTDYDTRLLALAHVATSSPWYAAYLNDTTASTTIPRPLWPKRQPYPADGRALLPFNRIVAYYGNFYSTGMGVLGQYDEGTVLSMLKSTAAQWAAADPATPVVPAIEYIDVTAQGSPGKDGMYRARMPDSQIDKALEMAKQVNGIVILDIQVGFSTVQDELPLIEKYLAMPQVHLALDPEFSMKHGLPPGEEIGTMSAADINYAINYLSTLVKENNLPPKVLVVHRFTEGMVTDSQDITPTPQVQVVMNMDGWGFPAKKIHTYDAVIAPYPVQFTGVKLFYKNDLLETPSRLLTTDEIFNLDPKPIYIQYQ